ncbi:MAG: hypothetical protein AABN95_22850 [Acidobacteriota bacterium]
MKRIPTAIFVFVVGGAGIAAMSAIAYYYPDASGYINLGVLVLTLAAVVGYFMRKKVNVGPRG